MANAEPTCSLCDCRGPLVRITASRSDTGEELDSVCVCPECWSGDVAGGTISDLLGGVIGHDPDSGVAYLLGTDPEPRHPMTP